MSVTSSRVYNPAQKKESFRVYRRINGKEYQEYYSDETEAHKRDKILGQLLEKSHPIEGYKTNFFHPHNLLHQGYDIGVSGIRVKYETRSQNMKPYLINSKGMGKGKSVTYALSSFDSVSDWIGAAITDAFENSDKDYGKDELSRALEWSKTTVCADVVLSELDHYRDTTGISVGDVSNTYSYMSKRGGVLYIRGGVVKSGAFRLSLRLRSPCDSDMIRCEKALDSYYSLFDRSAYFVAVVLSNSALGERNYWEYAEHVYLTMVTEWRMGLDQSNEDYETELLGLSLTPSKWFSLVNQYCVSIYGSNLLNC